MKRPIVILTALIVVLFSCTHDNISPSNGGTGSGSGGNGGGGSGNQGGGGTPPPNDSVCFKTDVLPLFQTYCASTGCHDGTSRGEDESFALTNYSNIMHGIVPRQPNQSAYFTIITDGTMPPRNAPKLTSSQIATIQKWISQRALNNTCTITSTCDTTKTTYSNGISQIFATYCNGCHGVAPGSGNVVLSNYASAKAAGTSLKATFITAINYNSANGAMNMPPGGPLSSCQVTQITKWINSGCPQ